ncbi:MAG: hypothetical protein IPI60_04815 [Saprospiraceae bacterium]|nr:hypothetical protein [Saprospiraceae bacterium]
MKKILLLSIFASLFLSSCIKDKCTETRTLFEYKPIYVKKEDFRNAPIQNVAARTLQQPGKIYFYNNFIFINELRKGIHVIDNSNPSQPIPVTFIEIPGNVDIAISYGTLYADSYTDLLSINISDPQQIQVIHRQTDVFPLLGEDSNGILAYYEKSDNVMKIDCSDPEFANTFFNRGGLLWASAEFDSSSGAANSGSGSGPAGIGGSMARFTIAKGHLYCIDQMTLNTFALNVNGTLESPVITEIGWGIETIFPYKDNLFVGASNGMHILDISSPGTPVYRTAFQHANACDPVVVYNDVAYVTLRDGNECNGFVNQLDVVDVQNLNNPALIKSFSMDHPHGLSIFEDKLYLCEGTHGLKIFDIKDNTKIDRNLISHEKGFEAFDVVLIPGVSLLVIGKDGFRQYDYSNSNDLKLLSLIAVQR